MTHAADRMPTANNENMVIMIMNHYNYYLFVMTISILLCTLLDVPADISLYSTSNPFYPVVFN